MTHQKRYTAEEMRRASDNLAMVPTLSPWACSCVKNARTALHQAAHTESKVAGLVEALSGYLGAVDRMNEAMRDGINVHGALSELTGYEEMAREALSKFRGEA